MTLKNDNTLRAEGADAYENGISVFDCPYPEDSHARDMWTLGYHSWQREMQEMTMELPNNIGAW